MCYGLRCGSAHRADSCTWCLAARPRLVFEVLGVRSWWQRQCSENKRTHARRCCRCCCKVTWRHWFQTGSTPLHLAAHQGKLATCRTLVSLGANHLIRNNAKPSGRTAQDVAVANNHREVASYLHGVRPGLRPTCACSCTMTWLTYASHYLLLSVGCVLQLGTAAPSFRSRYGPGARDELPEEEEDYA